MILRRPANFFAKKINEVRNWKNKLQNVPCFILGNAPSLDDYPIYRLEPYFSIGINRAFKRLDPTILLWQDIQLYYQERQEIPKLKALLFCRDTADPPGLAYHYRLVLDNFKLTADPSILYGIGSSGPLAFQLAYVLGCNPIILVGYDCQYREDKTDFYGKNKDHTDRTLSHCSRGLKWIKNLKTDRKIIYCSQSGSADYTMSFDEIIEFCSIGSGRSYFVSRLLS